MSKSKLEINERSIRTELKSYENKPYDCLYEYIWNSFDAGATQVSLDYDLPENGFGYVKNVTLTDNGKGWDFEDDATTNNFMSSNKIHKNNKTLPKGHLGRGRYAFIWIAEKLYAFSNGEKLSLQHNTVIQKEKIKPNGVGTKIVFDVITEEFSNILSSAEIQNKLIIEFGWYLLQNENLKLSINGQDLDINTNINDQLTLFHESFPEELKAELDENISVRITLWNDKPSEYSKFYFLNIDNHEIFKQNTGFNKKSDNFWHSIYIKSNLFETEEDLSDEDETAQQKLSFGDKKTRRLKKKVIDFLKIQLSDLRKPYLYTQSNELLEELKDEKIIPNLAEFGIYDADSYGDLLKTIYIISPSLFVGKSKAEKKFICATFAGLLSNQDDTLIKTILEQLQELSEDEKQDLLDVLQRSSLSNVLKTIKEVDHRLDVLDKLKCLISEHEKETLEVKHLQKILDDNFWLFGEQFRLFSSTEGALKNVLTKYAKEELGIDDPDLNSQPNGEVDLFLTKTETSGEIQKNIIVELKRASVNLGKTQYDQIEAYMEKIIEQNLCNGENQFWEFYLVGKNYNDHISNKIESAKNHGEKSKGLCYNIKDGRVKIYVRKWSDILEAEWGTKMHHLKEKLQIKATKAKNTPEEITEELTK